MLGLPTESYEDIEGIAELGHKVVEAYKNIVLCSKAFYAFSVGAAGQYRDFEGKTDFPENTTGKTGWRALQI